MIHALNVARKICLIMMVTTLTGFVAGAVMVGIMCSIDDDDVHDLFVCHLCEH